MNIIIIIVIIIYYYSLDRQGRVGVIGVQDDESLLFRQIRSCGSLQGCRVVIHHNLDIRSDEGLCECCGCVMVH